MAKKKIVFTWGRFNPPTIGHGVVMDRVAAEAKSRGADFKIYASKSEDPRKNPLTFKDKIKFLKQSFPKYSRNVDSNPRLNTILKVMASLEKKYSEVVVIVGSDRQQEFNKLLHVYNGREYDFEKINVVKHKLKIKVFFITSPLIQYFLLDYNFYYVLKLLLQV